MQVLLAPCEENVTPAGKRFVWIANLVFFYAVVKYRMIDAVFAGSVGLFQ